MNLDPSTSERVSTSSSQSGPHFTQEPAKAEAQKMELSPQASDQQFDEVVEVCQFEEDAIARPEASTGQKVAMLIAVILPLVGVGIATVWTWQYGLMNWAYLAMFLSGWVITSLGITIGFHRLMSHKSFETYRWVRATWMCIGAMSVEGAPLIWCAVHRRHHSRSDREGDPHSPHLHDEDTYWGMLKGLAYAQVGWLFAGYWTHPNLKKYVPDLLKDRLLVSLDKYYYIFVLISLIIPTVIGYMIDGGIGAFLGFVWGGLVRVFFTHHVTWSINSICHVFGRRDYKSNDLSTNNVLCGVLAMGEGWHNNHHAFPSSARHGLRWWQFDLSWIIIRSMKAVGLAWDLKLPSERALELKRIR